ncbi:MAG: D-glycero-beta-D-manno-heptose 1-phosphate adenylyltransferase [Desulfovibrio sp.]|jgi:rfaE bifunctional protein nucleotidyltransferase chain/domain|nr:D-glycero-beta-D-manno-heptose 1-phosphate adenylyltransferase [Desulfovibrio sp.]
MSAALPSNPKLYTPRTFAPVRAALPAEHRLVFTNGCFDILHPGHVDLLQRARALGQSLVLGLNSDDSVRRLNKGPERPLNRQEERAFVLAGLACVDYVIIFDEDTPLELIRSVRPQVLVKGGDWPVEKIVGREVVQALGGEVVSLPLLSGYSTTALVERIRG